MGFFVFFLALGIGGLFALYALAKSNVLPALTMVWAAHVSFFAMGVIRLLINRSDDIHYNLGNGDHVVLPWSDLNYAAGLTGLGFLCLLLGYFLPNRIYRIRALEQLDRRVSMPSTMKWWALILFLLAMMQYLIVGITHPLALLSALVSGRAAQFMDPGVTLMGQAGTANTFITVFTLLAYPAVGLVAYLMWRGRMTPLLWCLAGFFILQAFWSGTRQVLVPFALPFLAFARWTGRRRWFAIVLLLGIASFPTISAVQLYFRNTGFQNISVREATANVDTTDAVGGTEMIEVASAIDRYGQRTEYLNGQSYLALAVNIVPRVFWADKPNGFGLDNGNDLGFNGLCSVSAGWTGEAYANGGWWVIIPVGLIVGWLLRLIDNLTLSAGPFLLSFLFYAQIRFAFWVRGDSVASLGTVVFVLVLLLLLVNTVGRMGISVRHEHEEAEEAPAADASTLSPGVATPLSASL